MSSNGIDKRQRPQGISVDPHIRSRPAILAMVTISNSNLCFELSNNIFSLSMISIIDKEKGIVLKSYIVAVL